VGPATDVWSLAVTVLELFCSATECHSKAKNASFVRGDPALVLQEVGHALEWAFECFIIKHKSTPDTTYVSDGYPLLVNVLIASLAVRPSERISAEALHAQLLKAMNRVFPRTASVISGIEQKFNLQQQQCKGQCAAGLFQHQIRGDARKAHHFFRKALQIDPNDPTTRTCVELLRLDEMEGCFANNDALNTTLSRIDTCRHQSSAGGGGWDSEEEVAAGGASKSKSKKKKKARGGGSSTRKNKRHP
jgi:hypothetical protein